MYVVETEQGIVKQVIPCVDLDDANKKAAMLCGINGILFEGLCSVDGNARTYSIQIVY